MIDSTIVGPFGPAQKILSLPVSEILVAYLRKCGADVSRPFGELTEVSLFECESTGYRFWRPERIAGDEETYRILSSMWPNYYVSVERWEYKFVRNALQKTDNVLEVGCGRGYFLRSIEKLVNSAIGLELNEQAIEQKMTKSEILRRTIDEYAALVPNTFNAVCGFQVLEHVIDPCTFIKSCVACLRPGGLLFLSTPNMESAVLRNREDAFDLPPHHMGQFSERTYKSIAQLLGLQLVTVKVARRRVAASDTVTPLTQGHILYRATRSLTSRMLNLVYRVLREPGPYILVAFRKPSCGPSNAAL